MSTPALHERHCKPCEKGTPPLTRAQADILRAKLHAGWALSPDDRELARTFTFRNFHETMAFVNALAWIAHSEDHHPDLEVGYNRCRVRYSTHSIGGLSENDFICAARLDALFPAAA